MSAHPAAPALTAMAVTVVVLLARRPAGRPRGRRSPGAARLPWRRTAPTPVQVNNPGAAVRDAEIHVYRYWQQLQARPDQMD